jgi:hypothetical protein
MTSVLSRASEEIMKTALPTPSFRAMAIADGLIRSGRASHPQAIRGFIRLASFVSFDGERLLRGNTVEYASPLQPGFIDAMVRKGR